MTTDSDIRVGLDSTNARDGLRDLERDTNRAGDRIGRSLGSRLSSSLGSLSSSFGGISAALGPVAIAAGGVAAAFTGVTVGFKSFADEMDRIAKQSRRLGVTTEELISLRHAADQSGVQVEKMEKVLAKLSQVGQTSGDSLKKLGINLNDFEKSSVNERLNLMADAFQDVVDPSERLRMAVKLFGEEDGVQMITMLENGSEALKAYAADASALGLTVGSDVTSKVEFFNDRLDDTMKSVTAVGRVFFSELAPFFATVMEGISVFAKSFAIAFKSIAGYISFGLTTYWNFATSLVDAVYTVIQPALDFFGSLWSDNASTIGDAISFIGDLYLGLVRDLLNIGKTFQIVLAAFDAFWANAKLFTVKGINGIVSLTASGINKLIGHYARLFDAMPQQVKEFLGIDPSGWKISTDSWKIDTSYLESETARAASVLSETIASEGAGDKFLKDFTEKQRKSLEVGIRESAKAPSVISSASTAGLTIGQEIAKGTKEGLKGQSADDYRELHKQMIESAYNFGDGAYLDELKTDTMSGLESYMNDLSKIVQEKSVDIFSSLGSGVSSAFKDSLSDGGDFGRSLQKLLGQTLTTIGEFLVQQGVAAIALGTIGAIPVIGELLLGPGAKGISAAAFAAAAISTSAGLGLIAAGTALGSSGTSSSRSSRGSVPSSGSSGSSRSRTFTDVTSVRDSSSGPIIVNFNRMTSSRRNKRELEEVLGR